MTLHAQLIAGAVVELENIFEAPRAELIAWIKTLETDEFFIDESSFYEGIDDFDLVNWSETYGMDTLPREVMLGKLAVELTGLDWPTYGDGPETTEIFVAAMKKALAARGWAWREQE